MHVKTFLQSIVKRKKTLPQILGVFCFFLLCGIIPQTSISAAEVNNNLRQVTTHPSDDFDPAISSDGKWIVFTSARSGNLDIWIRQVSGGRAYQITKHQADDYLPVWNNQGNKIAFVSKRDDAAGDIWTINIRSYSEFART